jgi:hypothetical protein
VDERDGNRASSRVKGSGRSRIASTGSATSAGTSSPNRSQPRPIRLGTTSTPPASRLAVAGERIW